MSTHINVASVISFHESVFFAVEAEDGVVVGEQENLVLETDFLLGQELGFGENDYRIVGFERDSGNLLLLYDVLFRVFVCCCPIITY